MGVMFPHRRAARIAETSPSSELLLTQRTADGDGAVIELHRGAICSIQGAERFDIQEVIASGGQGTVFRACLRDTGETVALKVFHQSGIDSQRALKDEFRSLATLQHPGIVRMYELHVGADYAFFTMELVDGVELDAYLRAVLSAGVRAQYWGAVRLVITQLAIAIQAAHAAGLLHLDIKPGNVRVTEHGRVVLLDFGLVRHARQRAGVIERAGGTPPYMAPEQLGEASKLSEKTDWYAFGAVLSQLLDADPLARLAKRKREAVRGHASDAPRDLTTLCAALSAYDPEARPSGREVLARLGALTPRYSFSPSSAERVVGRLPEQATLQDLFEQHARGHWTGTTLVQLSGSPGVGKTYLVRNFVERLAREQKAHVFTGRCFQRAMLPYRLLDELMDQLAEAARRAGVAAVSDDDMLALSRMFRSFALQTDSARADALPPDEITPRALRALQQILGAVAGDGRPLVLWLDDVQWTDLDSIPLLLALLAQNTLSLLLVLSGQYFDASRPLERGLGELVHSQAHVRFYDIVLEGLSAADAAALIALLDPAQLSVKDRIWLQGEGNPLRMTELLRHGGMDALPVQTTGELSVPLDQLYIGRVAHLDERTRRLLELLALSNKPLSGALLLAADGRDSEDLSGLRELQRGAFTTAADGVVDLTHDTVRQSIRSYLSQPQRTAAHAALAAAHSAHNAFDHEVLAYHCEGAGELDASIQHLQRAAEASAAALAFVRAAPMYEHAFELLGPARSEQARSLALRAIELSLLAGHFEEAEPRLRKLLAEVGLPTFRSEQAALLWCAVELTRVWLRRVPAEVQARPIDELMRLRIEASQAALRGYSTSATFRGAVYSLILLRLACDAGEAWRIALASVHVASCLTLANVGWAKRYAQKLLDRAKRLAEGDSELTALVESGYGPAELFSGQWRSAYAKLNAGGVSFARKFGPEWILAGQMSLIALDQLGELQQLTRDAQRILESGLQQGNRMIAGETRLWCALGALAADRVEEARLQLALAEPCAPKNLFLFVHWLLLRVRVQISLYEGDYRQALYTLQRERRALRGSGLLTIQFIRVLACQLEAIAVAGEAASGRLSRQRASARLDVLLRMLARDEAPHVRATRAVLRACQLSVRGQVQSAVHVLQRAESHYEQADMKVHAAGMRLQRCLLDGEPEALGLEEEAMRRLGIQAPRRWVRWLAPNAPRR
jgi:eukaryotic-like serine/threonine-protein kinase